jgi:hypothetical protein
MAMNKAVWLKRINIALFFLLPFQAVTALLSEVINPNVFEVMHPLGGLLLVLCAFAHIGFNWSWVRSVVFKKRG